MYLLQIKYHEYDSAINAFMAQHRTILGSQWTAENLRYFALVTMIDILDCKDWIVDWEMVTKASCINANYPDSTHSSKIYIYE